ncbi:UDP-glucosyltransferase 2-like isoform X2 [Daktulosphaira vitifoliae]|uniref:UDP-glucosyltransferase 2-like isoform X2 n=1 Tax=Daktulosphaira vitifoliae TaxID=58002 RepID=UPI0021AA675D|nr:UDP-glucosyltransferase 2-like isoform X2 [Daktulosphaira vitifoliae]
MKYCPFFSIVFYILGIFSIIPARCARILAIETIGAKSHWNFMRAVLQTLTDNGHQVVVFTPFLDGNRKNYTEISLPQEIPRQINLEMDSTLQKWESPINSISYLASAVKRYRDVIFSEKQIQELDSNSKFDLVIIEPITTEDFSVIATKLNVPIIYVSPTTTLSYMERFFIGQILNPAYVSHLFYKQTNITHSFTHRFNNFILYAFELSRLFYEESFTHSVHFKRYENIPPTKPSIIFQNIHYITELSRPFMPNVIQIGGIHLNSPKSIPSDILEFIENSPNGVIFFTLGSIMSVSTLPDHILNTLKKAFSKFPQRILLKFEGEMKEKPVNVMTKKWFPQRDILMHPNVILFISHGGISGMYEAVDAGVPVLGFPLCFDQPRNIDSLVEAGMALSMDLMSLSEEPFYEAVTELINNKKYTENAKITSERFKDRPMSPAESVVYWTNYVIRYKGAHHLKSQAHELTWYQYFLLDVISVIFLVVETISQKIT